MISRFEWSELQGFGGKPVEVGQRRDCRIPKTSCALDFAIIPSSRVLLGKSLRV